jgi:hypothetical protein
MRGKDFFRSLGFEEHLPLSRGLALADLDTRRGLPRAPPRALLFSFPRKLLRNETLLLLSFHPPMTSHNVLYEPHIHPSRRGMSWAPCTTRTISNSIVYKRVLSVSLSLLLIPSHEMHAYQYMNHPIHEEAQKLYMRGYQFLVQSRDYWARAERCWLEGIDIKKRAFWRDPVFGVEELTLLALGDAAAASGNKLYDQADQLLAISFAPSGGIG